MSLQKHHVRVGLPQQHERSYSIHIGTGLLTALTELIAPQTLPKQVLILTDANVGPLYASTVQQQLADRTVLVHTINVGEQAKSLASFTEVMTTLIEHNFNRDCAIIALGGGVVGDLAGFVAATFQRGVDFYQVPTTLLAQVDSSVGGKTAVNHPGGKNLIGAFYQPQAVIIDTNCLETLSSRDFACGLAEVVKYGIIYDADFFDWLEANAQALLQRNAGALTYAIARSCEIKAEIVAEDEQERGIRALLNLGHTFGHAIEAAAHASGDYDAWYHGEAVAAGTMIAAQFMQQQGDFSNADVARIEHLFEQFELPVYAPQIPLTQWQGYMQRDKKVKAGKLRLILPTAIGRAEVRTVTEWDAVSQAILARTAPQ